MAALSSGEAGQAHLLDTEAHVAIVASLLTAKGELLQTRKWGCTALANLADGG